GHPAAHQGQAAVRFRDASEAREPDHPRPPASRPPQEITARPPQPVSGAALRRWRNSNRSEGEIGIVVIGKPSASEIAEAKTAAPGITPASPAPLMPSGLSGDGVSRWSISIPSEI